MGQIKCEGAPRAGLEVKLMQHRFFLPDQPIGVDHTDANGNFTLTAFPTAGMQTVSIDIIHDCYGDRRCIWFKYELPHEAVAPGAVPYNFGLEELWPSKYTKGVVWCVPTKGGFSGQTNTTSSDQPTTTKKP
ncbi:unnamed protein product, partial [Mesorhabditis spiculigera]